MTDHPGSGCPTVPFRPPLLTVGRAADAALVVRGEMDCDTAGLVGDAGETALARHDGDLVVDLSKLGFIDCGGLTALVLLRGRCRAAHRRLVLRDVPRRLARVFRIAGLNELLTAPPAACADR